jgi:hypothetical protein
MMVSAEMRTRATAAVAFVELRSGVRIGNRQLNAPERISRQTLPALPPEDRPRCLSLALASVAQQAQTIQIEIAG